MSKPVFQDLFAFSGRRNRKSYLLYALAITVALVVVWGVAFAVLGQGGWIGIIVAGLVSLPVAVSGWAVGAQRCRDFGWTGWAILLSVVPYLGAIFAIAIVFIPGNQGPNRYGADPIGTAAQ